MFKNFILRFVALFLLLGLLDAAAPTTSLALKMSMGELRAQFEEKYKKSWGDADSKERKKFVRELRRNEKSEIEARRKKDAKVRAEGQWRSTQVSLAVRQGFLKKHGKKWQEASREEQKEYLAWVKKGKEKRRKVIEKRKKRDERARQQYERRKKQEQKTIERAAKQKQRKEKRKKKEHERKRKKAKKEIERMKKEIERRRKQSFR